jgi:hypothetical protein
MIFRPVSWHIHRPLWPESHDCGGTGPGRRPRSGVWRRAPPRPPPAEAARRRLARPVRPAATSPAGRDATPRRSRNVTELLPPGASGPEHSGASASAQRASVHGAYAPPGRRAPPARGAHDAHGACTRRRQGPGAAQGGARVTMRRTRGSRKRTRAPSERAGRTGPYEPAGAVRNSEPYGDGGSRSRRHVCGRAHAAGAQPRGTGRRLSRRGAGRTGPGARRPAGVPRRRGSLAAPASAPARGATSSAPRRCGPAPRRRSRGWRWCRHCPRSAGGCWRRRAPR